MMTKATISQLDAIIQRLQNMHPWNINEIDIKTGKVKPWYEVTSGIVLDIVIQDHDLKTQVQSITAQIAFWGRMKALTYRVWQIEERLMRVWRSKKFLELYAPEDPPKGWKKPSKEIVDAQIRQTSEYAEFYTRVERAEEAYNATDAVLNAFRAKKDLLKDHVIKQQNDSAPRLDII